MGKKLGLGIVGLLVLGAVYYFVAGYEQITTQMKKVINTELTSLQKEGFSIQNREIQKEKEHFILSFDDTHKIAQFFTRQGVHLNVNDAAFLKGFQLGVDVNYLADTYSAIAFDMYPVALPSALTSGTLNTEDKKILAQVEKMLEKRTFLIHVAVNKLGTEFKGHMNDINEVLTGEKEVKLSMKGFTFSGDLQDHALHSIEQNLKIFNIKVADEMALTFSGLKSNYLVTGKTSYDYTSYYQIDSILVDSNADLHIETDKLTVNSTSVVKDGLASGEMQTKTDTVTMSAKGKNYSLKNFILNVKAANLDMSAFEKLQQINVNDEQAVNAMLQKLISKGVQFEIPTLSIASIEAEGQKMDGFDVNAKVDIDKSLDISSTQVNPMAALLAIDANFNFTLSAGLFGIIAQQPKAMMALMLFPPKDVNGKKAYNIELKDGKLTVNGMSVN
jgi:hypothetical protein